MFVWNKKQSTNPARVPRAARSINVAVTSLSLFGINPPRMGFSLNVDSFYQPLMNFMTMAV